MLVTYGSYAFKRKEYNLCVLTDKTLNLTDPLKTTTTKKKKQKKKKKKKKKKNTASDFLFIFDWT